MSSCGRGAPVLETYWWSYTVVVEVSARKSSSLVVVRTEKHINRVG